MFRSVTRLWLMKDAWICVSSSLGCVEHWYYIKCGNFGPHVLLLVRGLRVVALCILIPFIHTHVVLFCSIITSHFILFWLTGILSHNTHLPQLSVSFYWGDGRSSPGLPTRWQLTCPCRHSFAYFGLLSHELKNTVFCVSACLYISGSSTVQSWVVWMMYVFLLIQGCACDLAHFQRVEYLRILPLRLEQRVGITWELVRSAEPCVCRTRICSVGKTSRRFSCTEKFEMHCCKAQLKLKL